MQVVFKNAALEELYKSGKQKMYLDTVRNKAVLNASISRMVSKQAKIEEAKKKKQALQKKIFGETIPESV